MWQQPLTAENSSAQRRARAQAVAELFAAGNFQPAVWQMLQAMAGEENIYRDAVLTSRTGAFPAQSKRLRMPASRRGLLAASSLRLYIGRHLGIALRPR